MDRLFLGFYIKLTLSLLLAAVLGIALIVPRIEKRFMHNIEESMAIPMRVLAHEIADELVRNPGPSPMIERATRRYGIPATILPRAQVELSAERLARLDRGEVVAVIALGRARSATLHLRIGDSSQVMRLGPLNLIHPMGQGRGLGFLFFGMAGLSIGVYLLVLPLRRRLAALSRAADTFGRGDLTARAVVDSRDAIGTLAGDFNQMAQEIQRLVAAQKELLRMVSHELRTPLQRMHFAFEKVLTADNAAQRQDGIRRVERDLGELDTLIEELITYVRLEASPALPRESVDLHELCEEVMAMQSELTDELALRTVMASDTSPLGVANPRLLRRALGNLIKNGIHHARTRVDLTISHSFGQLHLDVDDDGPGIPIALRARLFEPFCRLDIELQRGRVGCGLGLAIVRRIAEQHRGAITVDTSPLGGARFRLSLPQAAAS